MTPAASRVARWFIAADSHNLVVKQARDSRICSPDAWSCWIGNARILAAYVLPNISLENEG
jgi:hypothetical protein